MCSYVCFIFVYAGPPALTVNIMKNIENSSIVVQWDAVDDSLLTTYTIIWNDESDDYLRAATVEEQTSYTITGLTLDTVYTITVTAANMCGNGPDFSTSISFSTGTTFTTTSISPTVTASTNHMTIVSTANPSSSTAATAISSGTITTTTTTTTIITRLATTVITTVVGSYIVIPTGITYPNTATTTSNIDSPTPTTNPADTTTADETSEFAF